MDTSDFILKRQQLRLNLDLRRAEIAQRASSARFGVIPWLLISGVGVFVGVRSRTLLRRLLSAVVWTLISPAVFGLFNRRSDGFIQQLIGKIFPATSPKVPAKK